MVFFRDDKDDGDEGLKGEGQPLIRFQSRTGVQAANCGLKKPLGFLIVRRAKKLNYGRTKKSDLHLQSFYKQRISKVRDSKVCIDGHHSKYAYYEKKALMGDGHQQPHVDRSNCFCKYQT